MSDILLEVLEAMDMPREGLLRWIEHNERFCKRHGERRYREWLELYAQCRTALQGEACSPTARQR